MSGQFLLSFLSVRFSSWYLQIRKDWLISGVRGSPLDNTYATMVYPLHKSTEIRFFKKENGSQPKQAFAKEFELLQLVPFPPICKFHHARKYRHSAMR